MRWHNSEVLKTLTCGSQRHVYLSCTTNNMAADDLVMQEASVSTAIVLTRAGFLSLVWSGLRLCLANHMAGYWTGYFRNLACDWLSIVWAYSKQETSKGPKISTGILVSAAQLLSIYKHQTCYKYSSYTTGITMANIHLQWKETPWNFLSNLGAIHWQFSILNEFWCNIYSTVICFRLSDSVLKHCGHTMPDSITHAPVHINDFRGVLARYVKCTG